MKPSRAQYFFANGRLIQILFVPWVTVFPLLLACYTAITLAPVLTPVFQWWHLLVITFFVLIALLLGVLVGLIVCGFPLLGLVVLVHYIRGRMNGAPFREGDWVRILAGPHRDRVARVSSVSRSWAGDGIRLELGECDTKAPREEFSPVELMKMASVMPEVNSSVASKSG